MQSKENISYTMKAVIILISIYKGKKGARLHSNIEEIIDL